ncbi:MAG: hypothetical protein IPM97_09280 [Bdellovibrionaceae bacterium]|nr:hypothetical protein [Pseudobdellovibrionaceae bacterium]
MIRSFFAVFIFILVASASHAQTQHDQRIRQSSSDVSWGELAIASPLMALEDFFVRNKNLSDAEKVRLMMKEDVRKTFFRLQALTRMLETQESEFFGEQRSYFKGIEDAIGKLDLSNSLRKESELVGSALLINHFGRQQLAAQESLLTTMKASGLWNEPEETIARLKRDFANKGSWAVGSKERQFFIDIISGYAKKLHKSVKENEFDNSDIEKGLHELRRRLRWILIQTTALDGFVQFYNEANLKAAISNWFEVAKAENPDLLMSKFMRISTPNVEKPILVPLQSFALMTELVSKIGKSKDGAEMQLYFREALDATGATVEQKNAILKKLDENLQIEEVDHQALSRQIEAQLAETKLLKEFAESLEKMN